MKKSLQLVLFLLCDHNWYSLQTLCVIGALPDSIVISIFILFWEKRQSGCFHGIMGLRVLGFKIPVICGLNSRIPTVGVNRGRDLISLCTLLPCASRLCSISGVPYTFKKRCPWSSLAWLRVLKEVNLELFWTRRHKRTSILSFCLPY